MLAVDTVERAEIVQMLQNTMHCLNCGRRLKRGHGHSRITGYCSQRCYYSKPPKMAYLEQVHGKPAREVIIETLNKTKSTYVTADLLGISRHTLHQWQKNLGIKRHVEWR